jgi:hypothetical protein
VARALGDWYWARGKEPYRQHFASIESVKEIPPAEAKPYACGDMRIRHPKEAKGHDYHATTEPSQCRDGGNGGCC